LTNWGHRPAGAARTATTAILEQLEDDRWWTARALVQATGYRTSAIKVAMDMLAESGTVSVKREKHPQTGHWSSMVKLVRLTPKRKGKTR
jgi:hypothetical protein